MCGIDIKRKQKDFPYYLRLFTMLLRWGHLCEILLFRNQKFSLESNCEHINYLGSMDDVVDDAIKEKGYFNSYGKSGGLTKRNCSSRSSKTFQNSKNSQLFCCIVKLSVSVIVGNCFSIFSNILTVLLMYRVQI
ncbi:hypothetical protein CEXT_516541 [Caerostris extrusa]|uniref:Uncharacterized protein n=1 Tax=Caerostris extrusa TaxID=172846 RepID=A0AAV4PYJ9_CAEEX|nr:hypothetical protein CEXT_516541 [Caerostris extrusa]